MFYRIMLTPKGVQIEVKINDLIDKFKSYLLPLFNTWKLDTLKQIQEKIINPLFLIDNKNIIKLCFPNEVII